MDIYNRNGESVGQMEISQDVMETPVNGGVLHQVVLMHLANKRSGTACTKNRSEVKGSNKKLFRQKGTGMARAGRRRTPTRVGGGVAFGPKPRDYSFDVPKKMRIIAIKSALADKFQNNNAIILEGINMEHPKTKELLGIIEKLGIQKNEKIMIVLDEPNENVFLSARNIPRLSVQVWDTLNTYSILWHDKLLFTQSAYQKIKDRYFGTMNINEQSVISDQ